MLVWGSLVIESDIVDLVAHVGQPKARYRPRGEAFLQVFVGDDRRELELGNDATDLPPQWDPKMSKPPVRARIERVAGGYRIVPIPGRDVKINDRPLKNPHVLKGGDEFRFESFLAVFTTAREELPWPMAMVIWPPEGPPVEVRTHRTRINIGVDESCDVIIEDETLDLLHCVITRFRNGIMRIEDNGSFNGIYVDGIQVVDTIGLRSGAEIRIGNTRIKAWADAPDSLDLTSDHPAQDQHDGIPDGDPLSPYAVELGPEYVQRRRRTFDDEVPTRIEAWGETVDVRPRQRPSQFRGYPEEEDGAERPPDWAPLDRNLPQKGAGNKRAGRFREGDTGAEWKLKDKAGITLVHKKDRPVKPRRGK